MINPNMTDTSGNRWLVFFNIPNSISWIRIVLMFVSMRYFGRRNYLLFIIYLTISGFLDSFDGILARALNQTSFLGLFLEHILDQYAHYLTYACVGFLYPSYIMYFYFEIALELWNSMFDLYRHVLPATDQSWLQKSTFLSANCAPAIYSSPNLRLLNWYGPDAFHTLLVIRYILIHDHDRQWIIYLKRYVSMKRVIQLIRYVLILCGFFAVLRTVVTSCFFVDKLSRLADAR